MLIEGSSGSSGGLVGEHQPDEPMRDGGRRAGRNFFHPDVLRGSGVVMMLLAMSMGVVIQMNAIFRP